MIVNDRNEWGQLGLPEQGELTLTVVLPRALNQRLSESAYAVHETNNYHIVTLLEKKAKACANDSPGVTGSFTAWLACLEFSPRGRNEEVVQLRLSLPESLYLALEKAAERTRDGSGQLRHERFHLILGAALERLEAVAEPMHEREDGNGQEGTRKHWEAEDRVDSPTQS